MNLFNDQELFWRSSYSKDYILKNSNFDRGLLLKGWREIVRKIDAPDTILEYGANIGRNIEALSDIFPAASKTAIEISPDAASVLRDKFPALNIINKSILESSVEGGSYELAFTMGVLIHIHPDNLIDSLRRIISSSKRYVLVGEYFNREPVSLTYQGEEEKLFKCDFGKIILEKFGDELSLLDYGFLWGHLYDKGGFDDITWWMFERR
ncbi:MULTISPECIES: pseudaminic acid biosynthesis-associated methylase [Rhizobium/Agrobacterium group]|uniref:pseudaminic acid biosynthesis-associated methylase n=1 Tax=Rhizobium oryzihabitans TaxID=2267833 RepID=UPI0040348E10